MIFSVVFSVNIVSSAVSDEKSFIYNDIDSGSVAITGYTGTESDIVVPGTLGGKTVKEIKSQAFSNNEKLEKLTIPSTVERFDCDKLDSCPKLKEIIVDDGNAKYASKDGVLFSKDFLYLYAYPAHKADESYKILDETGIIVSFCGNKNLKSIDLSNNARTRSIAINSFAFKYCTALENVNIGIHASDDIYDHSVIGYRAFLGCTALKEIVIPSTVRDIQESPFAECTALEKISVATANEKYCSIDGVLFEKNGSDKKLLSYPPAIKNESYTVPDGVTEIGYEAFGDCNYTSDIEIPAFVTKMGEYAFEKASSVKEVALGEGITEIPSGCFKDSNLSIVHVRGKITKIGQYSFSGCKITNPDAIISNIAEIPMGAFAYCESLSDVHFPANVKSIGFDAFRECTSLSYVNFSGSTEARTIDGYAFADCTSLAGAYIGEEVESIGNSAFYNCPALKSAEIRSMNTEMDYYAFGFVSSDDGFIRKGDIIITCRLNSKAHTYAKENEFDYIIIDHPVVCGSDGKVVYKVIKEPDCTHPGTQSVYCEKCGHLVAKNIAVEPLGHDEEYKLTGYPPTCTEPGLTDGTKCSKCRETVTEQKPIPATGHGETETIKGYPATCTKDGLTDGEKCTVCLKMAVEQKSIPALGHEYKDGVCTRCGAKESDPDPIPNPNPNPNPEPGSDTDAKLTLKDGSKLVIDNENKTVTLIPESTSGMKYSEFKSQFTSEISVSAGDDENVKNGTAFTFNGTEYKIIIKGDLNSDGRINAADARTILRIAAKLENPDDITKSAADINSDGRVSSAEARNVLRFSAKLSPVIWHYIPGK